MHTQNSTHRSQIEKLSNYMSIPDGSYIYWHYKNKEEISKLLGLVLVQTYDPRLLNPIFRTSSESGFQNKVGNIFK